MSDATTFPVAPQHPVPDHPHVRLIVAFMRAISDGRTAEQMAEFYHPRVEQVEFPNQLVKAGMVRDLAAITEAGKRGKQVVTQQSFDLRSAVVMGDLVACEVTWRATLAIPLGAIPAGGTMVAHFAQFYEYEDGRIRRQRNYDCFEPF
ncbi:MAG: nuclear transport factor 2 family protein [Gemmatimonadetes bacterium]|nr:nuclear transport factor 2 family protein [Gemmatimonadota bacterium]